MQDFLHQQYGLRMSFLKGEQWVGYMLETLARSPNFRLLTYTLPKTNSKSPWKYREKNKRKPDRLPTNIFFRADRWVLGSVSFHRQNCWLFWLLCPHQEAQRKAENISDKQNTRRFAAAFWSYHINMIFTRFRLNILLEKDCASTHWFEHKQIQ